MKKEGVARPRTKKVCREQSPCFLLCTGLGKHEFCYSLYKYVFLDGTVCGSVAGVSVSVMLVLGSER